MLFIICTQLISLRCIFRCIFRGCSKAPLHDTFYPIVSPFMEVSEGRAGLLAECASLPVPDNITSINKVPLWQDIAWSHYTAATECKCRLHRSPSQE
ncbi:hypothetical protein XELAEV_18016586mg [Xenopus laevis]|uniref:Uncharacterized protein n=1 Tax=Xenopus laevis TaxID=8355 RepID=A0A974DC79_XENLA|nr:hypothetical protein XELAEV_18016586mg [Xenopus laevis]